GRGCLTLVLVVCDEQADFEKTRVGVAEPRDALAGRQLSLLMLASDFVRSTPLTQPCFELPDFRAQLAKARRHASCPSASSCSANQVRMYSMSAVVGVPGP